MLPTFFHGFRIYLSIVKLEAAIAKMTSMEKAVVLFLIADHIHSLMINDDTKGFVNIFTAPHHYNEVEIIIALSTLEKGRQYKENSLAQMKRHCGAYCENDMDMNTPDFDVMEKGVVAHTMLMATIGAELNSFLKKRIYKVWQQLLSAQALLPDVLKNIHELYEAHKELNKELNISSPEELSNSYFNITLTASEVMNIIKLFQPASLSLKEFLLLNKKDTVVLKVRPWVRFWARKIDLAVFGLCLSFPLFLCLAIFAGVFNNSSLLKTNDFVLVLLVLFLWIFVESTLLHFWGTTPGKWLLKIQLKDINGNKPSLKNAFRRSVAVWFKGLAMGLPIVNLFTLCFAYAQLTENKITTWDKKGAFTVMHGKIGILRTGIAMIVIILISIFGYLIH